MSSVTSRPDDSVMSSATSRPGRLRDVISDLTAARLRDVISDLTAALSKRSPGEEDLEEASRGPKDILQRMELNWI
ncbi:unnamed protein product [Boreogadus saida]